MPENEKQTEDRAPHEIEAEIADKRADLEEDLAKLAHTVREKVDVPARVQREFRERPLVAYAAVGVALVVGMMLGARRAKLNRALDMLETATAAG